MNPNNENELFMPAAAPAGNLLLREKLPTPQGTSFPRPKQSYAHGYVNEMEDAVDCALDPERYPQSGAMMAWDTMAVLMAGYESSEKSGVFVDVSELGSGSRVHGKRDARPQASPRCLSEAIALLEMPEPPPRGAASCRRSRGHALQFLF